MYLPSEYWPSEYHGAEYWGQAEAAAPAVAVVRPGFPLWWVLFFFSSSTGAIDAGPLFVGSRSRRLAGATSRRLEGVLSRRLTAGTSRREQ